MDQPTPPLFGLIRDRMDWLSQRQRVLAQNIANADTPGFRPQDLTPFAARVAASRGGADAPARTHARHIDAAGSGAQDFGRQAQRTVYESTPTGNGVVLEEQMAKVNDTAMSHRLATQLYKKYLGMVRMAASSRQ
jgi:flagellar basal-body rod protein FlgB